DQAFFHRDFDAETAELAARLHLHVAEALGVHVARMRIEPGQHAVDRGFDQLGVVRLLDVVGAHALEHVAEQVELAIGVGGRRLGARAQHDRMRLHREKRHCRSGCRAEKNERGLAHHPRTFSPSPDAHHGPGSTGTPSLRNSIYKTGWLDPVARMAAMWELFPITATGSPVSTNCPRSTDIRSIPASNT